MYNHTTTKNFSLWSSSFFKLSDDTTDALFTCGWCDVVQTVAVDGNNLGVAQDET